MKSTLLKILLLLLIVSACNRKLAVISDLKSARESDSIIIQNYKYDIMRQYADGDTLTNSQLDTLWAHDNSLRFADSEVTYSPDGKFKIYVIELEGCGAYCNSEWFSWVHYAQNGKQKAKETPFHIIDTIIRLPDSKYLIIDSYGNRPASVLTISCQSASVISFSDSLIFHKIPYRKQDQFGYCQEFGVEVETDARSFIRYKSGVLSYHYGNNYAYSQEKDIDTIRDGQFRYTNGQFVLENEKVTVFNREQK